MKVSEILEADIEAELDADELEALKGRAKRMARNVRDAKRTLKKVEKAYAEFLKADVEDIELSDYEW